VNIEFVFVGCRVFSVEYWALLVKGSLGTEQRACARLETVYIALMLYRVFRVEHMGLQVRDIELWGVCARRLECECRVLLL